MGQMPVYRLISDIETAAGQNVEFIPRRIPGEAGPDFLVIPQVRHDSLFAGHLVDRFPRHGHFSPPGRTASDRHTDAAHRSLTQIKMDNGWHGLLPAPRA